ncbi:unnamed protein product [Brachionus calyciflorus]|uniref:RAI1-like domain-containing protein n=1 Tax=Brachionus calyciflorus TaxID=104777 RepID=A0A814QQC6_9BILA|nr:unnamed protein product [Brachionus calyciflorus]
MAKKSSDWLTWHLKNSTLITEIFQNELTIPDFDCTQLNNYEQIGSYSWSSYSRPYNPIIVIPGRPSVLIQNLQSLVSQHLIFNSEQSIIDENRFYLHNHPMEPILRTVPICSPKFEFSKIDFLTDRNNLRKLLDFVENKTDRSFIIDFQKVGNFILMVRNEERNLGRDNSFGKDFENVASLVNQGYCGHRRIVTYSFGDLNFVTRFEVDCVEDDDLEFKEDDYFRNKLKFSDKSKLSYIIDGKFRPRVLVELTSRSKTDFPVKKWAQMFFSKTDYLVIGRHRDGILNRIQKLSFEQVTHILQNRKNIQPTMGRLNSLMHKIKELVKDENCVYSLVYDYSNKSMKFCKLDNHQPYLPNDLIEQFSNKNI